MGAYMMPGYLLIEFACGKVPLQALKDVGVRMPGCLVFSQGALLKVFQKALSEIWEPEASQRERKGTVNNSKWRKIRPMRPNRTEREAKGRQPTQKLLENHAVKPTKFYFLCIIKFFL